MNRIKTGVGMGFAEVNITPAFSMELIGFDRQDNLSRGILDKLIAQIVIWDDQTRKTCIVSIDSIGFTAEKSNFLREAIAGRLCTNREQVMLCFSHTHSAPDAGNEKGYFDFVCTRILKGIDEAMKTLAPVKAISGIAKADIGINRRNQAGILDRRIGVLKIADAMTNQLRLVILRVTAHANVLTSDNYLVSADFFGATRELLEKKYDCKIMLTQGASGNVRPKYQHSDAVFMEEHPHEAMIMKKTPDIVKKRFDESMEALAKMATEIDKALGAVIESMIPEPIYRMDMFSEIQSFSADVPTMKRAGEITDEALREAGIDGTKWFEEVKKLHMKQIDHQITNMEIQFFILNDGCLCGVADEVMCEISLDILQKVKNQNIFFGGYTNGCGGYLPTKEEYQRGGYEVLWSYLVYYRYHGRIMPLNSDTAERLAAFITAKWNQRTMIESFHEIGFL